MQGAYDFRSIHPRVRMGTASDRYSGWQGQIYTSSLYSGRITHRARKLGHRSFTEEVLPVESVREYFDHFSVLEVDFTFYRTLLDSRGAPTPTLSLLREYGSHLGENDSLVLKAPQSVFAQKLRGRGGSFAENPEYLDADVFIRRFWEPAVDCLGDHLLGVVLEQEYQKADGRLPTAVLARELDQFFARLPHDSRYHVELRTENYLTAELFEVLEKHGVGQVLSHWTWLPSLRRQFQKAGSRVFNASGLLVVRLLTPRNVRYEDAYAQAYPFDRLVDGMMSPDMISDTVWLMRQSIERQFTATIIINNRAGGNAPEMARLIQAAALDMA